MKKILAFGASSSKKSINKQLANHTAGLLENAEMTLLDLNDFEMLIYSIDKEEANGIPELAKKFKKHIQDADGIIISFAEHNGAYASAYKNIYDWVSRIDSNVWENKPMLLLATSPGARGGQSVLELALNNYGFSNKNISGHFSLPSFYDNFSAEEGIKNDALNSNLKQTVQKFKTAL